MRLYRKYSILASYVQVLGAVFQLIIFLQHPQESLE